MDDAQSMGHDCGYRGPAPDTIRFNLHLQRKRSLMRNIVIVAVMFTATLAAQPGAAACDRACLEGFVNQYLDALAAHRLSGLALAPRVQFSENDQLQEFGDGVGKAVTGIGNYKLYAADPQTGQVVFFGTLREKSGPVAFALRLKIESRRIREIETLVVRDGGAGAAVEAMGTPDSQFLAAVPAAARVSRQALISAADSYWNSVEQSNANNVPFDNGCNRIQNGIQTTNNPEFSITPGWSWNPLALGCREQIDSKFFSFIQKIAPRRYLLVDEERQVVFGFFLAQAPGNVTTVDSPGHGKSDLPAAVTGRYSIDVAELYKFKGGKIRQVEAIQLRLPYGAKSAFAPGR
jgi:hypothetical protein